MGGVETGTLDLARHLVRMQHKAVVVSAGGELVKELEACGALHYQLPVHKKSFFTMARMVGRLAQIIRKEEIDIVHARSRVPAWIAYYACRRTHTVFVTTCHGHYSRHSFSRVMGWGKRVIVLSTVIARHMIDDFGVSRDRIRLIPRSVDLKRFVFQSPEKKRKKKELHVGIIGRITPLKGHRTFLKAMAAVARSCAGLKIWIVGDAPESKLAYKEEIQTLSKRLGLAENTEFLGTQRDIPAVMAHLDIMVLATKTHEAFGRVIVEAQACGVPVVATRVGGVIDIVEDGQTGLLVPAEDPEALSEAVLRLARDLPLAERLAHNAYEKVRREYGVERLVKDTLAVYREALTRHKLLVIKLSALGDVILATASLRAIKEQCASYHVSCVVSEEHKEVLLRCPFIDELIVIDLKGRHRGAGGMMKAGTLLRSKGFDAVIDLQNNRRSHILGFLSQAGKRYGYRNRKLGFLITHPVSRRGTASRSPASPVQHQFEVLRLAGIDPQDERLELWPSDEDRLSVRGLLQSYWAGGSEKLIGISLGASSRWMTKNLPFETVVKVCEELGARDMRLVVTGTAAESALAQELTTRLKQIRIINACGKTTVNQLAALCDECSVFISGDSAPLHISAAMGTPVVAVFGPTDPRRHMPPAEACVIIQKPVQCAPCYRPFCKHTTCMRSVRPADIIEAVERLL